MYKNINITDNNIMFLFTIKRYPVKKLNTFKNYALSFLYTSLLTYIIYTCILYTYF